MNEGKCDDCELPATNFVFDHQPEALRFGPFYEQTRLMASHKWCDAHERRRASWRRMTLRQCAALRCLMLSARGRSDWLEPIGDVPVFHALVRMGLAERMRQAETIRGESRHHYWYFRITQAGHDALEEYERSGNRAAAR